MKKLLTIMLLLAAMLSFASCEDKNEPENNPFVGEWENTTDYESTWNEHVHNSLIYTFSSDYKATFRYRSYFNGVLNNEYYQYHTYFIETDENGAKYIVIKDFEREHWLVGLLDGNKLTFGHYYYNSSNEVEHWGEEIFTRIK